MKMFVGILLVIALVGLPANVQAQSSSDEGLVAEWRFDEGSGNVVKDSSGNGNDGVIHGATWTVGKVGSALRFDGKDDYVEVADDSSLDITDAITIEAWVKPYQLDGYDNIVTKDLANDDRNYHFTTGGDELWFVFTGGSTHATTSANLAVDTWYHVVLTFSDTNNLIKIYVDGIPKTLNTGGTETATASTNTAPLQIGHAYWDSKNKYPFNGIIDEVRIYNRALTADEIK